MADQKKLYIDGLNYASRFFPIFGKNEWVYPSEAFTKVQKFVKSLQRDGWYLEVFIDAAAHSEEAQEKWISRREEEVRKCKRGVPQGANVMLGEMFKQAGVVVHFSLDADNDDTLVSYAVANNACILSKDKDMYRYTYAGNQLTVFPDFTMEKGRVYLSPPRPIEFKGEKREVIIPPPKTSHQDPCFVRIARDFRYRRGTPSPLTRYYGNPHKKVQPLRKALYVKLNITEPVTEAYPEWDESTQSVAWIRETVLPDPSFLHLLEPGKINLAFDTFFGTNTEMPPHAPHTKALWNNHIYALWATLAEIISASTQQRMFQLLNNSLPPKPQNSKYSRNATNSTYSQISRNSRNSRNPHYSQNQRGASANLETAMNNLAL